MQEVVVVGGGIAGASVALALRERGVAVNVVEWERAGAAATGASGGILAPQYESSGPTPLFRLLMLARSFYPRFADRAKALAGVRLQLRWCGMLVANFSEDEHAGAEGTVRWQRTAGAVAELISPGEAAELQPGIQPDARSYLWLPEEGQVDSQLLADSLGTLLAAAGVRLIRGRAVEARSRGGRAEGVRLLDGRFLPADQVVIAAGAWSGTITGLPRRLPVRPVRGMMLRYAPQTGLRCLLAAHAGRYLVPRADGTVLAGSTMDEVGFDRSLDDAGLREIGASAGRLFPMLAEHPVLERWADLRPLSADGLPVIGPDPELCGLVYATGYGRNGILLGPLAGEIIADLMTEGHSAREWRPFSPDRDSVLS